MNQNQIDLNVVAKRFCQGVAIANMNDAFLLIMDTGDAKSTYVFTPEHLKRLHQYIGFNIEEFEKRSRQNRSKLGTRYSKSHSVR